MNGADHVPFCLIIYNLFISVNLQVYVAGGLRVVHQVSRQSQRDLRRELSAL